jgi:hypothetical protein
MELFIRFADALALAFAEHKKVAVLEQFKKGERI